MSKQPRPALRGSSYDEYICIRNFMSAEGGMGLSGVKALVYALIYSHSPADTLANNTGCYFGSIAYTAARIGAGRSTTIDALKWLLKQGLIIEKGEHVQGDSSTTKRYIANRKRAIAAQRQFKEYWDAREGSYQQETPSRPETVPDSDFPENGDFARPETAPDYSVPRPETVPANQLISDFLPSRPETVPDDNSPRPETVLDHVQKSDPIVQVDKPLRSSSCPNSFPTPNPSKPNAGRMGEGEVNQEIGADLDPELLAAVKELMLRSINQHAPLDEVLPAYRKALAKGYTPEQIDRGYTAYIARYRGKHPVDPNYAIRLSNYLVRGDGLSIDEPKPEQSAKARAASRRALMQELFECGDSVFKALYSAVPTDAEVAQGTATKGDQDIAKFRLNDYLSYQQGKPGTAYETHVRQMLGQGNANESEVQHG